MSKENSLEVILESENFKLFLKIAREFCTYIEDGKENGDIFLENIRKYFLKLYNSILSMKSVEILYDYDSNNLDNDDYNKITKHIAIRIPIDYYWEVHNPLDFDNHDALCGSLIDDIADIYLDIKDGLIDYDTGKTEAIENAVFNFKHDFSSHWGQHLVSGLKTIHWHLNPYTG